MSRNSQQLGRVILPLIQQAQRRLGVWGILALILGAALYFVVLQPLAAKQFGVTLPTLADILDPPPSTPAAKRPAPAVDADNLEGVLTPTGRGAYRSAAGLRYTRGSEQGTRLAHLMTHAVDDPSRVGQHGVFDNGDPAAVVRLVDEAYLKALAGDGVEAEREGDQTVYNIDMGRRVGYVGGQSGNRRGKPAADHIRLIVQGDRLITAFPFRP